MLKASSAVIENTKKMQFYSYFENPYFFFSENFEDRSLRKHRLCDYWIINVHAEICCFEGEKIFIHLTEGRKYYGLGIKVVIIKTMRAALNKHLKSKSIIKTFTNFYSFYNGLGMV